MRRGVGLAAMSLTGLALFSGANAPPGHGLPQIAPVLPVPRAQPAAPTRAASVTKVVAPVVAPILRHGQSASWVPGRVSPDVEWPLKDDVTAAYSLAVAVSPSGCHLPVTLLMAIGQVESGNLAGHALDASHRAAPPILGPVLDGSAWSAVTDSDGGRLDGNTRWDRAVGPMQFIPESWRVAGVDMDGDGTRDPQDIYDAAGAAMVYLCAGGRDLATTAGLRSAILGFNHSEAYLRVVLRQKAAYDAAAGSLGAPYAALGLGLASQQAAPEGVLQHSGTAGARPHDATPMSPTAPAAQQGSTSTSVIPATRPTTSPQPLPSASPEPTGNPTTSTPGDPVPTPEPIPTPDPTPAPDQDPTPVPTREPTPEPTPLPPCPTDIPTPALVIDPTTPVPADPAATCLPVPTPTSTP